MIVAAALISSRSVTSTTAGTLGGRIKYTKIAFGQNFIFTIIFIAIILVAPTILSLAMYYQVQNGIPYMGTAGLNLMFVGIWVSIFAGMFTLGLIFTRYLGFMKARGGS
jgi:hypothetical protein